MATRQMLARATESTNAPTPGYLYKDLIVAAQANPTVCQEMAQYLIQRLQQKNNPNVKFKCLKVIAKIADAVVHFKRCLAQSPHGVAEIKNHVNYRGQLDPVRGDEPNLKIRQAAQEALDAVYRETPTSSMSMSTAASHHHSYAGPSSSSAGGRMEGLGNPRYTDPRLDPRYNGAHPTTVGDAVREVGEVVLGMIKDPLARNIDMSSVGMGGGAPSVPSRGFGELPQYQRPVGAPPPGSAELSRQTQGQWTMASNRGPNAVQTAPYYNNSNTATANSISTRGGEPDNYYANNNSNQQQHSHQTRASTGAVGGSWGNTGTSSSSGGGGLNIPPPPARGGSANNPHHHHHHVPPHHGGVTGTAAPADGSYERTLILELCPPSGMKAVPPPDKLANFSKVVPSLNPDLVCPAVLDCLEEGQPWIIRAKALCVMETCLYNGARLNDGTNPYRDFFYACQEEIVPLASHPRAAISGPAKRVLSLLGVQVDPNTNSSNAQDAPLTAAAAAPNLLDFDDDVVNNSTPISTTTTAPPSALPTENGSSGGGDTLFGGMQVKAGGATGTNAASSSASAVNFGTGMQVKSPAPATAAAPSLLDFGSVNKSAAAPSPMPPAQDIFRPDASATTTTSMFEQMSIKSPAQQQQPNSTTSTSNNNHMGAEDKKTDSEDAGDASATFMANGGGGGTAPAAASGSAFGFISGGGPAAATASPTPTKESFDPLKNFSPNSTNKKTMAMSQEQMQAMAYQQMMMQQQMQMQRMVLLQQHAQQQGMAVNMYPGVMPGVVPGVGVMPGGAGGGGGMVMPPGGGMPTGGVGAGVNNSGGNLAGLLFKPPTQAKKEDHKFDFVMDAMKTAGNK